MTDKRKEKTLKNHELTAIQIPDFEYALVAIRKCKANLCSPDAKFVLIA